MGNIRLVLAVTLAGAFWIGLDAARADDPEAVGCGDTSYCDRGCVLGDPWTLCANDSCIQFGGWVSSGLYSNAWGTPTNGTLGMRSVADGYTMNQLWFFAEKPLNTENGPDWGARVDYVFGVDGPDFQAFGDEDWDFGWNTGRDYGLSIPNLYAQIGFGDLTIKGGHFITTIGWEYMEDSLSFFTSRSITYYYSEPATHTGLLASYNLGENITLQGGWVAGWDSGWRNLNGASMLLGGATLAIGDDASLIWTFTAGNRGDFAGVDLGDIYMNTILRDDLGC